MTYETWKYTSPTYRAYLVASGRCAEAFAPKPTTGIAPEFSEWRHPGTGQTRHYINNATALVATSHLNLSNNQAREIRDYLTSSKFWLTTDGKLHCLRAYGTPRAMHPDEITDIIQAAVTAHN